MGIGKWPTVFLIPLFIFQDLVLRLRREPGSSPVYDMILRNELMKQDRFSDLIDLPAPFGEDAEALRGYLETFARPVNEAYQRFLVKLAEEGSDEEAAFQTVLNYARTRNLGGFVQSMRVDVPMPLPPRRVGQIEKKGRAKGMGKTPRVSDQFEDEEDLF